MCASYSHPSPITWEGLLDFHWEEILVKVWNVRGFIGKYTTNTNKAVKCQLVIKK